MIHVVSDSLGTWFIVPSLTNYTSKRNFSSPSATSIWYTNDIYLKHTVDIESVEIVPSTRLFASDIRGRGSNSMKRVGSSALPKITEGLDDPVSEEHYYYGNLFVKSYTYTNHRILPLLDKVQVLVVDSAYHRLIGQLQYWYQSAFVRNELLFLYFLGV